MRCEFPVSVVKSCGDIVSTTETMHSVPPCSITTQASTSIYFSEFIVVLCLENLYFFNSLSYHT